MEANEPWEYRRCEATAHQSNNNSGWATITHPFHPLKGQRFEVLKTRHLSGEKTLILRRSPHGSFAVLAEWTDWTLPTIHNDQLAIEQLLTAVQLVKDLRARHKQKRRKNKKEVDA